MILPFLLICSLLGAPNELLNEIIAEEASRKRKNYNKALELLDPESRAAVEARDRKYENQMKEQYRVRDAGNFFSRWNCEWIEYFETCEYKEDCSGFFKSQKTNWSLEWTTCNDTIINEITKIFPDTDLKFGDDYAWGRRCIPTVWGGVEFCGSIEDGSEVSRQFRVG